MLSESFRTAEADMAARSLREAQVDADRLLAATASALAADGDLLSGRGARRDRRAGGELRGGARPATIDSRSSDALKALGEGTEAFAAERMNRGIRRALAGPPRRGHLTMPIIKVLPHPEYCPERREIEAPPGDVDLRGAARERRRRSSTPAR